MSSIICNRKGVIEVSPGSSKPARRRQPQGKYPQLTSARQAPPYGEAVQSNRFYQYRNFAQSVGSRRTAAKRRESEKDGLKLLLPNPDEDRHRGNPTGEALQNGFT